MIVKSRDTLNSVGLLILRVAIGCLMLVHGVPKLMDFSAMAKNFPDPIGMGGKLSLISAIGAEVGCSVLLILGLLTRVASVPLAFTMIVALVFIHGADPWLKKELAAIFLSVYATLLFTGGGRFSIDHLIWGRGKTATVDKARPRGEENS